MTQPPQDPMPYPPTAHQPLHVVPKKKSSAPWIVGGVVAFLLVCCGGSAIIGALGDDPPTSTTNTSAGSTSTTAPAATTPATKPTTAAAPAKTTAPPKPAPKITYRPLTERQWKLVAKNPDNYVGKTYIVYGVVTQFDAATGDNAFLAMVSGKNMAETYEYETNTMLSGDAGKLKNLVEDDEFRATVRVVGSHSYDTQIGGNTTVPLLAIASIKVL